MTTIAQRLTELATHLDLSTLTKEQVASCLHAEAEAVARLEADEKKARECLMMVNNHHLAGAAIYAKAREVAETRLPRPVDGA